jgi:hypothetical protein
MEMLGEMQGVQGKTWLRCSRCHHMSLVLNDVQAQQDQGKLDPTTATVYRPDLKFNVGDAIFHSEWNDVGKVLSKMRTSNGSESILVAFEREGERRLIANLKLDTVTTEN